MFGILPELLYLCRSKLRTYFNNNEKTQEECWQPSWCAVGDFVHQHIDGACTVGLGRILSADLSKPVTVGEGESDGHGDAEGRGDGQRG